MWSAAQHNHNIFLPFHYMLECAWTHGDHLGPLAEWAGLVLFRGRAGALRENRCPSCRVTICCECTMLYESALFTNEVIPQSMHTERALQKHKQQDQAHLLQMKSPPTHTVQYTTSFLPLSHTLDWELWLSVQFLKHTVQYLHKASVDLKLDLYHLSLE
jgi:hypothetical protein